MKPRADGSSKRRPYYLAEAMQFTIPFIKALTVATGNIPYIYSEIDISENSIEEPVYVTPSSPTVLPTFQHDEVHDSEDSTPADDHSGQNSFVACARGKRVRIDVDTQPMESTEAKRNRIDIKQTATHFQAHFQRRDALKMFLLSTLPDLESMSDYQIRKFKRKTLQTIEDILSENAYHPTSLSSRQSESPASAFREELDVGFIKTESRE